MAATRRLQFDAIGTKWDVQLTTAINDTDWQALASAIATRIADFDRTYSRFRDDSLVAQIAHAAGCYQLPPDGFALLSFYEQLYRQTDGQVTPLIGQAMSDAGYDASYSLKSSPLQAPPAWEDVLSYDTTSITVSQPVLLDFGAAGKGYLVDLLAEMMSAAHPESLLINASGDMLHRGPTTLDVGLENPADTSEAIGIVQLANSSLCASAGSKRAWGTFHHILDPSTLTPTADILATWVIAKDTMTADGLATALFFTEPEALSAYHFSYALLDKQMGLSYSHDFPLTLFEAA